MKKFLMIPLKVGKLLLALMLLGGLMFYEVAVSKDAISTDTANDGAYVEYTENDFSCDSNAYLSAEKWDFYETFIEENGTEADLIFFKKIRDGEYGWALENVDHKQQSDTINEFLADYSNAMMQQNPDGFLVYVNAISFQDGEWGTSGTQETQTLPESYFERICLGSYSLQTDLFDLLSGYNYPNFKTETEMNVYNALLEQYYYAYDQTTMWESLYAFSYIRNVSGATITDTTFQIDSIEIYKYEITIYLHGNPKKQSEYPLLKDQTIRIGRVDNLVEYMERNNANDENAAWISCTQKRKELEECIDTVDYAYYTKLFGNEGYYQFSSADGTGNYMFVNEEGINDPKVYAMLTKWQSEKSLTKTMEAFGVEYDFDEDKVVENLWADRSDYNRDNYDNSGDVAVAMMGAKNYSYDPVSLTYTIGKYTYQITFQEYLNAQEILSDLGVELDDLYDAVNTDDYLILPEE